MPRWGWLLCWWWGPGVLLGLLVRLITKPEHLFEYTDGTWSLACWSWEGTWARSVLRSFGMGLICLGSSLFLTNRYFVTPHLTDVDPDRYLKTLVHELEHRKQQFWWGILFWPLYLLFYLALLARYLDHMDAYMAIPFEIAARKAEERVITGVTISDPS